MIISQSSRISSRFDLMIKHLQFREVPSTPPKPGEIVILCMGGSSTEGSPFNPDFPYDYPCLLEEELQARGYPVRVFNAGISAASSWHARNIAPKLMERLKPHIVTFSYHENDLVAEQFSTLRERFVPNVLLNLASRVPHVEALRSLIDLCESHHSIPIFLIEPIFEWVNGEKRHLSPDDRIEYGSFLPPSIRLWDPLPLFREHEDDLLFMDSVMHLNRWGNLLMARYLATRIRAEILEAGK